MSYVGPQASWFRAQTKGGKVKSSGPGSHVRAVFQYQVRQLGAAREWLNISDMAKAPFLPTLQQKSAPLCRPPPCSVVPSPDCFLAAVLDGHVDVDRPNICALWVGAQCVFKNGLSPLHIPELEL